MVSAPTNVSTFSPNSPMIFSPSMTASIRKNKPIEPIISNWLCLCFLHPMNSANTLVGITATTIHKWKVSLLNCNAPILGNSSRIIGMNRQWIAQVSDKKIANLSVMLFVDITLLFPHQWLSFFMTRFTNTGHFEMWTIRMKTRMWNIMMKII